MAGIGPKPSSNQVLSAAQMAKSGTVTRYLVHCKGVHLSGLTTGLSLLGTQNQVLKRLVGVFQATQRRIASPGKHYSTKLSASDSQAHSKGERKQAEACKYTSHQQTQNSFGCLSKGEYHHLPGIALPAETRPKMNVLALNPCRP